MAPIAKENEAPTGNSSSGTSAVNKAAAETVRSQPVALEIPVTVNGARTIEGSDKREPFSESTQTVLVFTNGAVIRLASPLASGQLVFLTNEKTKKEVVCQVVKSKNYRTVTGYVELEFTEPAPGFWGMRFPGVAGPAPAGNAPVATRPTPTVVAPPTSSVPSPPKVVPSSAPVATKLVDPEIAVPTPSVPAAVAPVTPPSVLPSKTVSSIPTLDPSSLWGDAPAQNAAKPSTAEPIPYTVKPDGPAPKSKDYSREIAAIFSVPQAPAEPKFETKVAAPSAAQITPPAPVVPSRPVASAPIIASEPLLASKTSSTSTDELKQQAARLQEQLSAMLFTEPLPKSSSVSPVVPVAPKEEAAKVDNVAENVFQLRPADLAPSPVVPPAPVKLTPPVAKPAKSALDAEEVQIPAWLAPLARNTETVVSEAPVKSESRAVAEPEISSSTQAVSESQAIPATDSAERGQPTMFGGQLLTDSTMPTEATSSSGSKKGLFIGVAAAAILAVAGAAWYAKQPGNLLTGAPAGKQAVSQNTNFESVPALGTATSETTPLSSKSTTSAPATTPASQPPSSIAPSSTAASPAPVSAKNITPAPRFSEPAFEPAQPKRPSLGDVRLATPVIKSSAKPADVAEGEPALDSQVAPNADSVASLTAGRSKGPAAPTPIGGDVKQAKLIKSVPPIYPALARSQRISGNVQIDALIDAQGNVTTMKVLSGSPILHQSALAAVKQWKYEPAMLDGKPTPMHLTVTVQFRVQ
jgi:TonB family protein